MFDLSVSEGCSFLCSPPRLEAWLSLCSAVVLPKQQKTEGPRRPLQWKADGRSFDGSRLQSAVQESKLLIRRHPSSGWERVEEERGRKDRATPDTRRLASFKRLRMAHSWLALVHTCKNTYTDADQWKYSGSRSCSLPFISGIILFSTGSPVKGLFCSRERERENSCFSLLIFAIHCHPIIRSHHPIQVGIKRRRRRRRRERRRRRRG